MRRAVIDLGTNTFNLLIGERVGSEWLILHRDRIGVALGKGGICQSVLTPEAITRALDALKHLMNDCRKWQVSSLRAMGTSAIRDAQNQVFFLQLVRDECGIEVEVISGLKEAEYIFNGVSRFHSRSGNAVIMDIGGGSTEFVFVDKTNVNHAFSANIGLIRMAEQFQHSDPLTSEEIISFESWLDQVLSEAFAKNQVTNLIGASGTFETFFEMLFSQPYPQTLDSQILPINNLMNCLNDLIHSSASWRKGHPDIIPVRKQLSNLAALKSRWVIRKLGIKHVYVSPASMKEGVLFGDDNDWRQNSNLL
jgi:exopolyphosphatase/guanosine-5'-triphosphate,3'-diphosphate pyrophosphatase